LIATIVAGCAAPPRPDSALQSIPCWFEIPAGHAATCYRLAVPESRDRPGGRILTLPVAVLSTPATRRHADPIVYLNGGPGSAVGLYPDAMKWWWPYIDRVPWLQGRDLILMDQRGVGLAKPNLDCPEIERAGLQLLRLSGDPARRRAVYIAAAEKCRQRWLAAGYVLGDYDTRATAADFAELRRALGVAAWNLYSVSYGTRIALVLMHEHPEGIRSVILDSAYPPEVHFFETQRAAIDAAFGKVFAACAADEACSKSAPDMKRAFFELVERYNAAPTSVQFTGDRMGAVEEIPFTGALLIERALEILNEGDALAEMPELLRAARDSDQHALEDVVADLAAGYSGPNYFSEGKYFAVDCEEEVPFTDAARIRADIAAHPAFVNFGMVADDWYVCANWVEPAARPISKAPVMSDVPALVLQGEFDAITSPGSGRLAASRLRRGYYIEFAQVGHKVVDQSVCGQKIAATFFERPNETPSLPCLDDKPQRPW
jgi:pimeloyl-ACP methyl ester carboxylesterase